MVKFWIKKFNRINFLFNFKLNKIKKNQTNIFN